MLKKAIVFVTASMAVLGASTAMAKDVRPAALSFKGAAVGQPVAEAPAPARARVAKRHDLFGLSGLPLLAAAGGVGLTAGLIAVVATNDSSPS